MDKQAAIKTLHELWRETNDSWYKEVYNMAIEALEKPTEAVKDCISRERAIEIVKRAETKEIAYLALINLEPKEIPTCDECRLPECLADKQDDWIPVSERLPEVRDIYIVSGRMKYDFEKEYTYFTDCAEYLPIGNTGGTDWETWTDWYEGQQEYEILTWKPLPKPYKEKDK